MLSLFLGGLGAGRFYLGYPAVGAAQLTVNVLGLGLIVASLLPNVAFTFPRVLLMVPGVLLVLILVVWVLLDTMLIFRGTVTGPNNTALIR